MINKIFFFLVFLGVMYMNPALAQQPQEASNDEECHSLSDSSVGSSDELKLQQECRSGYDTDDQGDDLQDGRLSNREDQQRNQDMLESIQASLEFERSEQAQADEILAVGQGRTPRD